MVLEFIEWLDDTIDRIWTKIADCIFNAAVWIVTVALFPLWIIPFLFWYFAIWKKGEKENEKN